MRIGHLPEVCQSDYEGPSLHRTWKMMSNDDRSWTAWLRLQSGTDLRCLICASIWPSDHIQKLSQMLMATMLPGNKVFFGIGHDELSQSDTFKLLLCFSSSVLPHPPSRCPVTSPPPPLSGKVRQEEEPVQALGWKHLIRHHLQQLRPTGNVSHFNPFPPDSLSTSFVVFNEDSN